MNKSDILFSIIIPVFNTGKYIEKCLDSVKKAMDTDCEVIIVNDGSQDNSEEIIKKYIDDLPIEYKDKFIYKYKENKGLADTKNVGIELARGKYISVVDSDDYIADNFYTLARKYVEQDYDVIIYDLYIVYENKKKKDENGKDIVLSNYIARAYREDKERSKDALLCGAMQGSSCNKIIKKSLYEPYKFPTNKEYEDTAVTPFIIEDAKKIKYIPYPLYYYLQREKSIVATNTYISAFYKICENISNVLIEKGKYDVYNEVINEFFVNRALETLYEDYRKNKKKFNDNIISFAINNKKTIEFIINNEMVYKQDNWYSPRQKKLINSLFVNLLNEKYKDVKKEFFMRKFINYIRKCYRAMIHLIKTIIGRA